MPEEEIIYITLPEGYPLTRLDKAIADQLPDISRARIQSFIEDEKVKVSGRVEKKPSLRVGSGQELILSIPPAIDDTPRPQDIPLNIVYEDDDLLVINKVVGMVVHPAAGNFEGTLVNALLFHCGDSLSGVGGVKRPGIVHRLDKDTSGLMVVAKHDKAHQGLSGQLQNKSLFRLYYSFVWRSPTIIKGKVDLPIGRHSTNRLKMAVQKSSGRDAVTHYQSIESFQDAVSLFECRLETGRTHQIRVHMQQIKHPLVGDPLYGLPDQEGRALLKKAGYEPKVIEKIAEFPRQALHAAEIGFIHPVSGKKMHFKTEYPEDMQNLKNYLKSVV
jgi:23S rRNA pseudouridine1911/1915/1917 synthase